MNQDQIKEAIAKGMAFATRHESDVSKDAVEFWLHTGEMGKSMWLKAAAAVMELVGPKPLVWMRNGTHWACGRGYVVRQQYSRYVLTIRNQFDQTFDTLEAAQAAAQAHADAAHWANTQLGVETNGVNNE